mmetsp:Transcript_14501/g.17178  ORF Transcript_14501/g.17178 Transcript_14501/m.17178 type:complete len:227 (-) Transcript_14501:17-697(-)|eukprot:CAMPEP_0198263388 /NCGR_PEP_ID=MMETSP1447-20131203/11723_1 /TAXON_ID=420782 /ORGANISM="Chaetoceros dichaeta, Strain CCMP1751" /LENGTH=226 /DNA_ID=CAMNT_0043951949 /DNA_START=160 /DNA_END=840 /DNA_ORIENTATION=-
MTSESSIPFERYDEEFLSLTSQIKSTISKVDIETSTTSTSEDSLQMAQNLLTQAKDLIQQMSIEARGMTNDRDLKDECLKKVRICKANLSNLEDDVKSLHSQLDRIALLNNPSSSQKGGGGGLSNDHRERLLQTNESLQNQNSTLENARRVMAETEDVAMDITQELARNRETMESARGRVRNVSGLTNRARRVLVSMRRREVQQKMVVYGVGVVMAIVVIYMLTLL